MVGQARDLAGFRALCVLALMATVAITWPLWDMRAAPPELPLIALPRLAPGVPLLAACVATLVWPLPGAAAVTAVVAYGMIGDQTRMQPEFFSLPLLLWGTLPLAGARFVARVSLIALWFYSGLGKLLSPQFLHDLGPRMAGALSAVIPVPMLGVLAAAVAGVEIVLAVLAIWPRTRRFAAWLALIVHAGILLSLAGNSAAHNVAVWPWNVVQAVSGFAFIAPWPNTIVAEWRAASWAPRVVAGALALLPLGFYAGVVDAYPAHQLYSAGTARATVYCPRGCRPDQDVNATWRAMNVPLPPQPRLFLATFARTCAPGDTLRIDDPHPPPWGAASQVHPCPAGSLPMAHP